MEGDAEKDMIYFRSYVQGTYRRLGIWESGI